MHSIENEFLKVSIREFGAELTSVFDKKNNIEHLWNADEQYWGWHAPVLFPVVGRCLNDEIIIDGQKYEMEKHGFARKCNFKLLELSDNKAVFSITQTEDTLKLYPYKFEFLIGYMLHGHKLVCHYEVINRDDKPIYFSLGGHPAFAVPFLSGEIYEDYYLQFEQAETLSRHYIDTEGFFNGITEKVMDNTDKLPLQRNMFSNDAYIFKDLKSRSVTIRSHKNQHSLKVSFPNFNYLGIWAKVNAPYVCIEPWLGCADTAGKVTEFSDKEGVMQLPTGNTFTSAITVEIE